MFMLLFACLLSEPTDSPSKATGLGEFVNSPENRGKGPGFEK